MHEINLTLIVHFYTNVSSFDVELVITQFQISRFVNITSFDDKSIEVSIAYDFFIFVSTRQRYFIYKRELYVMITFVIKYDYLCKHSYLSTIIHIDHRSLIHFLNSNLHENIYDHWANQLRRLNLFI